MYEEEINFLASSDMKRKKLDIIVFTTELKCCTQIKIYQAKHGLIAIILADLNSPYQHVFRPLSKEMHTTKFSSTQMTHPSTAWVVDLASS